MPGLRRPPHQGLLPPLRRDREQRLRHAWWRTSSCWAATSRTGRSPSCTPAWTRRSVSGCAGCAHHVEGEEMFLANYADVLTDAPLDKMIDRFARVGRGRRAARGAAAVGLPLREPGRGRCDLVDQHADARCRCGRTAATSMFRPEIFDHIAEDCDLVGDVCAPLAKEGRMMAYRHRGFWQPADTVKERTRWRRPTRVAPDRGCCGTPPTGTRCRPPSRSCRAGSTAGSPVPSR